MSPIISLNRLKKIVDLMPGAVQVVLPDWFPPTNEEAIDFFKVMVENSGGIGLVLYNPPHAKRKLTPEDIQLLKSNIPCLIGIKVAGGDNNWYDKMNKYCPDISIFVPSHHLASGYLKGAKGSYSNMACLNPLAAQKWYELIKKDEELSIDLKKRVNEFLGDYILPFIKNEYHSNQAVDKLLAAIGGWTDMGTRLRWPYRWIKEEVADALRLVAKGIIPEFF